MTSNRVDLSLAFLLAVATLVCASGMAAPLIHASDLLVAAAAGQLPAGAILNHSPCACHWTEHDLNMHAFVL